MAFRGTSPVVSVSMTISRMMGFRVSGDWRFRFVAIGDEIDLTEPMIF
jgi:hypothetical protein